MEHEPQLERQPREGILENAGPVDPSEDMIVANAVDGIYISSGATNPSI